MSGVGGTADGARAWREQLAQKGTRLLDLLKERPRPNAEWEVRAHGAVRRCRAAGSTTRVFLNDGAVDQHFEALEYFLQWTFRLKCVALNQKLSSVESNLFIHGFTQRELSTQY